MVTEAFNEAWNSLSPVQREAAEWTDGALLVLAGPGSGKTNVLTTRIAKLLSESPESKYRILALTFTNKAASEMRERVDKFAPGQYSRAFIGTFHSFCADVVRQHGVHLEIQPNFKIYSEDDDLNSILSDAVAEARKTSAIVTDLDKKLLPVIKRLKSFLIEPDNAIDAFSDKEFGARVAVVYPAYEAELRKHNVLDFESLVLEAYRLFSRFPNLAKRYRTVYKHICVDEFQDTNRAQYQLFRALTGTEYKNIYIVADDDQIIYQWNGASHQRIEELVTEYTPQVIQLPMNYRCPPEVVSIANNLISHNFLRAKSKRPLEAFQPSAGPNVIRLMPPYPDEDDEAKGIAQEIKHRHEMELSSTSVAVLARTRRLLLHIEEALRKAGLNAVISQRKTDFESTPFVWLQSILRLANERQSKSQLQNVCGAFAQLTGAEVDPDEVATMAKAGNRDYLQHWVKCLRLKELTAEVAPVVDRIQTDLSERKDFRRFSNFALDWFSRIAESPPQEGDEVVVERFARYDEERQVWVDLTRQIFEALGSDCSLEAFLQELQLRSKEPTPAGDAIVLMTIHSSKGKEFDHVYLVGMVEDELPSFQSRNKGDQSPEMEEERRECFVAITRCRVSLTLSYAQRYRGWPKRPSRFLTEMGLLPANVPSVAA